MTQSAWGKPRHRKHADGALDVKAELISAILHFIFDFLKRCFRVATVRPVVAQ